ncbi:hypothetical protein BALOs_0363 [Halobacteriovorax sp. BALOs_7]|nr:hypothetical protein BALOs_0363 [Halobacteriovorax sp. BALOs_7]
MIEFDSLIYLLLSLFILFVLFSRRVMTNTIWTATMTPLASIIGSGFLIAAPLLNSLSGNRAPFLMLILCAASYGVGEVIRWNIVDVEPRLESNDIENSKQNKIRINERLGEWVLSFAYILSITYYLYLFSSFFLRMTGEHSIYVEKGVVTLVIMSIAFFGHQHGLNSLEKLESVSVNIKLSIIITFLVGLISYQFFNAEGMREATEVANDLSFNTVSVALGLLIMVQGFETSRYLFEKYDRQMRVKSMRYAQLISSLIYLILIIFFVPVFHAHPLRGVISETSVIDIGKYVFTLAPTFLFAAAMASQLSAAVADMGGGGGLVSELSKGKIKSSNAYLIIALIGVVLVWFFNIFEIISYASKAFALYYFFQCVSSCLIQYRLNRKKFLFSVLMSLLCLVIVIFGRAYE